MKVFNEAFAAGELGGDMELAIRQLAEGKR